MSYLDSNTAAWNKNSVRYQASSDLNTECLDFGDSRCLTDDDLGLIKNVNNKKILELGCGGGNIGIYLSKLGAIVHGVDVSEKQLSHAKAQAEKESVDMTFEQSAIEDFVFKELYDVVISICAFQYVDNLAALFKNIHEYVVETGFLLFSTNHPAFYTAAYTTIWENEKRNPKYHDENAEVWKWNDEDSYSFTTFPHPVEFYINSLARCGFFISSIHELTVNHKNPETKEEELESRFPRFLVVKAFKNESS
jgi:2-polyprenyl-3-methyl-5-hydroxy-6-metoxy-1,4-benzoquinol methylase